MWKWIKLIGVNIFGGTEAMYVKSNELFGKDLVEYFNSRSTYYCPVVEYGNERSERK